MKNESHTTLLEYDHMQIKQVQAIINFLTSGKEINLLVSDKKLIRDIWEKH